VPPFAHLCKWGARIQRLAAACRAT
jgi:hypothetical protein